MGSGTIVAGIVVGLLASCVQSLGITIQRKSHVLNQALPLEQQRREYRRPLWLLGFTIFLSSNILGSLFQIASLPVVILAPLGAVSLLWNAFFARILLGDDLSLWVIAGTVLIAAGAVLIGVFGVVPEPTHSLDDLLALFRRPAFVVYFSLLGLFCVVCLTTTHVTEFSYFRRVRREQQTPSSSPSPSPAPIVIPTESSTDLTTERTPLLDRKPPPSSSTSRTASVASSGAGRRQRTPSSRVPLALALSYAAHSGIISGMCLVFAKSGVELLLLTLGGDNQFWRWQAWMLLLGLVGFALLQLWYLHKALTLADPTIVCPLAFCFYNLSSIVNGLVYYDQFALLSRAHLALVVAGMAILLCGVWAVSFLAIEVVPWTPTDVEEGEVTGDEEARLVQEVVVPPAAPSTLPFPITVVAPQPQPHSPTVDEPAEHTRQRHLRHSATTVMSAADDDAVASGMMRRARRRYTTVSAGEPLSPPAPGFSIGLSPVSPGFSLVGRGRRRRASASIGGGGSMAAGREAEEMRRTVSEGWRVGDDDENREVGEEERQERERQERTVRVVDVYGGAERTKGRGGPWGWVKALVGRRR